MYFFIFTIAKLINSGILKVLIEWAMTFAIKRAKSNDVYYLPTQLMCVDSRRLLFYSFLF